MLKENLLEMRRKLEELRNQIRQQIRNTFNDESEHLFLKYPQLKKYSWNQYTPYFNDGDECVFSANIDWYSILVNEEVDEGDWENKAYEISDYDAQTRKRVAKPGHEEEVEMYNDLYEFLSLFTDEDYKFMFGDHVKVIVHRDRIEADHLEHD
jgi:hypothetical protein